MSCKARPPSGSVTPERTREPCTSTSSSEPPPRSPTMPSGLWMPEMTPSAVRWASRLPERIVIGVRQMRSASAMKARPLRASRQAAVAIAQIRRTCRVSHKRAEALERGERGVDGVRRQQAGRLHLAAEAGQHLFVEDRRRRARQPLVDDEADRVRADIDDGDRRPVVEPALGRIGRSIASSAYAPSTRRRIRLRGDDSLSDLPRPDRLGFVMKYLWALNGSSPGAAFMRVELPSGKSFQLCSLSLKFATMIWPRTCSCTVGLRIGHSTSTRRSRLRGIMSAEEI